MKKPYEGFPLFPHRNGQWAKKVGGKTYYFGKEWREALAEWNEQEHHIRAGYGKVIMDGLTVEECSIRFLNSKKQEQKAYEIGERTFREYKREVEYFVSMVDGKRRTMESLTPEDFKKVRSDMHDRWAISTVHSRMGVIWIFMNWVEENLKIKSFTGSEFKRPVKKLIRRAKKKSGKLLFTAAEIRSMIDAAKPQMRAMILLGINSGIGNRDVAYLERAMIDGDWIDYTRRKSEIDRLIPLWPETKESLNAVIKYRDSHPIRKPFMINIDGYDYNSSEFVFFTKYGNLWYSDTENNTALATEFSKLMKECKCNRARHGYYTLRKTFRTIAAETKDKGASDLIMGHDETDMSTVYIQEIDKQRLLDVTNHVRKWLFNDGALAT